jgi:hypothetical protein
MSPNALKNKSLAAKKRTEEGRNNHFIGCMKGKHKTEEQKQKQSDAMKGKGLGKKRPDHSIKMKTLADQNDNYGMKNPDFRKAALIKRPTDFVSGQKNGRYIDGRKSVPGYAAASSSKRRARIFNQMPLTADLNKIAAFYRKAKELSLLTGEQYDVDHIAPLSKGGLHHEDNLQIITHIENIKKYNKLLLCKEAA